MRLDAVTDTDLVRVTVDDIDKDLLYVGETVIVFVKGFVVAIGVPDLLYVGDIEYVIDGVPERLNGGVVGIGLFVTVIVTDLVFGFDDGIALGLLVIEVVLDIVTDIVPVRVKGYVDGIGDRVTVIVVDGVGKPDAGTVIGGERLLVTDTVLDNETVKDVLFVSDSDFVIETVTVGLIV